MSNRVDNVEVMLKPVGDKFNLLVRHSGRRGKIILHREEVAPEKRVKTMTTVKAVVEKLIKTRLVMPTEVYTP